METSEIWFFPVLFLGLTGSTQLVVQFLQEEHTSTAFWLVVDLDAFTTHTLWFFREGGSVCVRV
jgi:hypothetical protein